MTNAEHVKLTGRALDIHRTTPGSLYSLEGCVTICRSCHGPQPKRKNGEPDLANGPRIGSITRVRGHFIGLAEASADKLGHDLTQWVNDAIRMRLEGEGSWPPPPPKPGR